MSCSSCFKDGHDNKASTTIAKTSTKSANMVCISWVPKRLFDDSTNKVRGKYMLISLSLSLSLFGCWLGGFLYNIKVAIERSQVQSSTWAARPHHIDRNAIGLPWMFKNISICLSKFGGHTCIHIRIYVCIFIHIHTYIQMGGYMYMYMYMYMYAYIYGHSVCYA